MTEKCTIAKRLDNKLALVTGAERGIGQEITAELALRGCNVIMAGKDKVLLEEAKKNLLKKYSSESHGIKACKHGDLVKKTLKPIVGDQLIPAKLDLASFESIGKFLTDFTKKATAIDIVVCNEDIRLESYSESYEGIETQMAVNHIGHYILIEALIPLLLKSLDSKLVIHTSSDYVSGKVDNLEPKKDGFRPYEAYANSKLAQMMYARYLNSEVINRKLIRENKLKVLMVDPGQVTGLTQKSPAIRLLSCGLVKSVRTPWDCVQSSLMAILDDNIQSGSFIVDSMVKQPNEIATNFKKCETLAKDTYEVINSFKSSGAILAYLGFTKL